MDINKFPPKTDEDKQAIGNFFKNQADIPKTQETALKVLEGLKGKYPSVKKWGIFGLCWGGKAATIISKNTGEFAASGQAHPAFLDPSDIEALTIPHLCLSSKDEDATAAKKVIDILNSRQNSHSEIYGEDFHGWMGARSDLKDPKQAASFEKGYGKAVEFFKTTL
ncbi:hypothetical protein ABW20_dc0109673 [Dactylellina cionopaga]|nr:hypothetical protein ABW20_dc0109673 [Dactylellina cionopaga]